MHMYLQTPVKLTATWPSSFRFAPEIVCHGVTGFVVNTLEEMMDAIGQVNQIELRRCREYVELRFDVPRMGGRLLVGLPAGLGSAREVSLQYPSK